MRQYLDLLQNVLDNGVETDDRTGVGTLSVFGTQTRYDLRDGFPAVTTKRLAFKSTVTELMWFIGGNESVDLLRRKGCKFWNEWELPNGTIGPGYGAQWRSWQNPHHMGTHDQLADVIEQIKNNPRSRRHIVSSWNVGELQEMALPPCHMMFQFYVRNGELSCHLYQRSGDLLLGVAVNIASYALLTHIVAHLTGLQVGEFVHTIGDAHIYKNHVEQVQLQLSRDVRSLPRLVFGEKAKAATSIDDFALRDDTKVEDFFALDGYVSHPTIKAEVAV